MEINTPDSSKMEYETVMESTVTPKTSTKVIGRTTKCMDTENSNGQTGEATKAYIISTKKMVSGFSNGLRVEYMKETGEMVSSMAMGSIFPQMESVREVFGKMARESSGNK
jgi:hypothetical protein